MTEAQGVRVAIQWLKSMSLDELNVPTIVAVVIMPRVIGYLERRLEASERPTERDVSGS